MNVRCEFISGCLLGCREGLSAESWGAEEVRTAWRCLSPCPRPHLAHLPQAPRPPFPTHLGCKPPSGFSFALRENLKFATTIGVLTTANPSPTPAHFTGQHSWGEWAPRTWPEPLISPELGSVASSTSGVRSGSGNQRGEAFFLPHHGPQLGAGDKENIKRYLVKDCLKWGCFCHGREGQLGIRG